LVIRRSFRRRPAARAVEERPWCDGTAVAPPQRVLSRLAEAFFRIGRHLERAESTARLLEVASHTLLDGARDGDERRWERVIAMAGAEAAFRRRHAEASRETAFAFLGFCDENPDAILPSIARARESARTARDRLSREMWEDLNGFFLETHALRPDQALAAGPHRFCRLIEVGSQRFHGVTETTLPHDEGWHFLRAGRALERAETVARVLTVHVRWTLDPGQWTVVLRTLGADECRRRRHRNRIDPGKDAELLLLDAHHPRSLRFNVAVLDASLRAISRTIPAGDADEAESLTGRLHVTLEYDGIDDILGRGLAAFLDDVLGTCRAIGDGIARSYFRGDRTPASAAAQAAQAQQQ
jgi:uncharacterized alpha-E superfamily protein